MLDIKKINYIKLSLMKKKSEINKHNKCDYDLFKSCTFNINEEFLNTYSNIDDEVLLENLLEVLYKDLLNNVEYNESKDFLGLWFNYKNIDIDNSIALSTLSNIKKYSKDEITPIYEFFKMTIKEYEDC